MRTIALIGYSKQKRDSGTHPASQLYTSVFFRLAKLYAKEHCDAYYILSLKYGLLAPWDQIEPYNLTHSDLNKEDRKRWISHLYQELLLLTKNNDTLVFLCGNNYSKELVLRFRLSDRIKCITPLAGRKIGEQLKWLKEHTEASLPPLEHVKSIRS